MRRSSYFQNSILIGLKSGQLAYSKNQNPMINKFSAIIEPRVLEFTADQMRINRDLIDPSTMSYLVTSPITYKPNFPKFLADSFERVLNEVKDDSRNIS
jgi:hypothetical protein